MALTKVSIKEKEEVILSNLVAGLLKSSIQITKELILAYKNGIDIFKLDEDSYIEELNSHLGDGAELDIQGILRNNLNKLK